VEFKDGVKQYILKETIAYIGGAQHAYILSKFSTFEQEIIVLLKAHQDVGQPLYVAMVQRMIKTLIQKGNLII
jgi:hypothetical protein